MSAEQQPRESLEAILQVERRGEDLFCAELEDFHGQALGGDVLARAALAARAFRDSEHDGVELCTLHGSFISTPPPATPLELRVHKLPGGCDIERYSIRVTEPREQRALCEVQALFAPLKEGVAFQDSEAPKGIPEPEELPTTLETARAEGWEDYASGPVEFRRAGPLWSDSPAGDRQSHVSWMKPRAEAPRDPAGRMAALVLLSEFYSHWGFERRIGPGFSNADYARLDHMLYVHRLATWDDWWLLEATCEISSGGRALAQRRLFTRSGELVASTVNHALVYTR